MKLIILNRDGVINYEHLTPIKSPDEWIPIPGSLDAIARLTYADYRLVVKTDGVNNNPGKRNIEILNRIHEKMHRLVNDAGGAIEAVFFSTAIKKTDSDRCSTTDLLGEIAQRSKTKLSGVPFVSANPIDLAAAHSLNAMGIFIHPEGEINFSSKTEIDNKLVFPNLATATDYLLSLSS
jgi:D-glycero-D-manno-heptose 1,7-bisphosphate phosphatase